MNFFKKNNPSEFKKQIKPLIGYFFVGGSAAIVEWSLFATFIYILKISYFLAAIISFIFATFFNYFISINTIFSSGERFNQKSEILLVLFVSGIGLLINLVFITILIEIFYTNSMLSKIIATGLTFFWNYSTRMYFIFHRSSQ